MYRKKVRSIGLVVVFILSFIISGCSSGGGSDSKDDGFNNVGAGSNSKRRIYYEVYGSSLENPFPDGRFDNDTCECVLIGNSDEGSTFNVSGYTSFIIRVSDNSGTLILDSIQAHNSNSFDWIVPQDDVVELLVSGTNKSYETMGANSITINVSADISGVWEVEGKNDTDGTEVDGRFCLLQTGSTVCGFYYHPETPENFSIISGSVQGNKIDLTLKDENQTYIHYTIDDQTVSGVWNNDYGDTGTGTITPVDAANAKFYGYYTIQSEDCGGGASDTVLIAPIKKGNSTSVPESTLYLPENSSSYSYLIDEGAGQNSIAILGNKITMNQTENNGEWEEWEIEFSTELDSFSANGRQLEYDCSETETSTFTVNGNRITCVDSCSKKTANGVSAGDPHIYTYDGVVYHDQSIGEFILSREDAVNGFEIQTRQGRISQYSSCVTFNTAVAMRLDSNIIEYRAANNEILIDGIIISLLENEVHTTTNGTSVKRENGIVCKDSASKVTVRVENRGLFIDVYVSVSDSFKGQLSGLLGNFDCDSNNDMMLRNGFITDNYNEFINNWRLFDAESLFTYAPGQNTGTFSEYQQCKIRLTSSQIESARQLYVNQFGEGICDDGMIISIATDLAAGMPQAEVLAWVASAREYATFSGTLWFKDNDGDGYGDNSITTINCSQPEGYVDNNLDCNDRDPLSYPGAEEIRDDGIDQDCDGYDLLGDDIDDDEDGYTENQGDCNDDDDSIYPGAPEIRDDGIDQDCDGNDLLGDDIDDDGDGYTENQGDCNDDDVSIYPGATEIRDDGVDQDCNGSDLIGDDIDDDGDGYTENEGDCDDDNPAINPGAAEIRDDGIDQDCDGSDLSGDDVDDDGDGYTENQGDCNDDNSLIHPGATEIRDDGIDQDCDGSDLLENDVDDDGDGYTENQGDCNDGDASIYPGATEIRDDGIDQDCDGSDLLENDVDDDGDGFTENQGDCNDGNPLINPGAAEVPEDGIDQNCDGQDNYCLDLSGDWTVQVTEVSNTGCSGSDDEGTHDITINRDGGDISIHVDPEDPPITGSINCENIAFDPMVETFEDGSVTTSINTFIMPNESSISFNIVEVITGPGYSCQINFASVGTRSDVDDDGDGFTENQGDCNDFDPSVHPGAVDTPEDGIDQDCNGQDEYCVNVTGNWNVQMTLTNDSGCPESGEDENFNAMIFRQDSIVMIFLDPQDPPIYGTVNCENFSFSPMVENFENGSVTTSISSFTMQNDNSFSCDVTEVITGPGYSCQLEFTAAGTRQ